MLCPRCQRPVAQTVSEGLCPKCLMIQLMDPERDPPGEVDSANNAVALDSLLAVPVPELESFGDYVGLKPRARGGMGIVYEARQVSLNRRVALKMILGGNLARDVDLRRFRSEAEAAARLDHPNIVPIYEVGERDGMPFFSMKLIEGRTLSERLADTESPVSHREAALLVSKVARAIHYAHEHGILHRDVKPSNILLDAHGEPQVTDFGLAKVDGSESNLTLSNAVLGTPAYMSPEQAAGKSRELTTLSDLYSLGAVLYELLAGHPPFQGATAFETIQQVIQNEPRAPSSWNPQVDVDLQTICLKCLEKEPHRRYASALGLAEDLERWSRHEPILARPSNTLELLIKWTYRHPWIAAFFAAVAVAAVLIITISATLGMRIAEESEKNRRQVVRLNVAEGNRLSLQGDPTRALLYFADALRLDAGRPPEEQVHRRRIAAAFGQVPRLEQMWFQEGAINAALFSSDDFSIATACEDASVRLWSLKTGALLLPPMLHSAPVTTVAFSPDGEKVVTTSSDGTARVWAASSGRLLTGPFPENESQLKRLGTPRVTFDPQGRRVISAQGAQAHVRDAATGAEMGTPLSLPRKIVHASFSPDGNRILLVGQGGLAQLFDSATHLPLFAPWELSDEAVGEWAGGWFSPEGDKVIVAHHAGQARIWNARNGHPISPVLRHAGFPRFLHAGFSLDGRYAYTLGFNGRLRIWDAQDGKPFGVQSESEVDWSTGGIDTGHGLVILPFLSHEVHVRRLDGQELWPALQHSAFVFCASLSSTGERIVTGDKLGVARVWSRRQEPALRTWSDSDPVVQSDWMRDGRQVYTVTQHGRITLRDWLKDSVTAQWLAGGFEVLDASMDAQGQTLALAGADGFLHVLDLATRREAFPPLLHEAAVRRVQFSRDGGRLISITRSSDPNLSVVHVWDAHTGKSLVGPISHPSWLDDAEFSPDGRWFLTACADGHVRVFRTSDGQPVCPPLRTGGFIWEAHFSPDGRRVVAANSDYSFEARSAYLFDLPSGRMAVELRGHRDGVTQAAFSPDGMHVATGSEDNSVRIWDSRTGLPVGAEMRHEGKILRLAFSPDGSMVATASQANTTRVWDARTGDPITPPLNHARQVRSIHFDAQSHRLLSSSDDGAIKVWDLEPEQASLSAILERVELLSAHRKDSDGTLVPLSRDALQQLWSRNRPSSR